ncbi:MAG: hypothetical protein CM15mP103_07460 [Gammaproteobacteria bacterium]|nr:MAG: hypothetical protein CM15mP103_07460 [Gammaproteobacteria bacterium]
MGFTGRPLRRISKCNFTESLLVLPIRAITWPASTCWPSAASSASLWPYALRYGVVMLNDQQRAIAGDTGARIHHYACCRCHHRRAALAIQINAFVPPRLNKRGSLSPQQARTSGPPAHWAWGSSRWIANARAGLVLAVWPRAWQ